MAQTRRALEPEQYYNLKQLPLEDKEEAVESTFNILPKKESGKIPVPPSPWPYGMNPTRIDPQYLDQSNKFFKMFPGTQEKVSSITNRSPLENLLAGYGYPDPQVLGSYDPRDKSIYIKDYGGLFSNNYEDTLGHEMTHAMGYGHPEADLIGSSYQDYLGAINSRKNYRKDINLPKEEPRPKGLDPSIMMMRKPLKKMVKK